MPSKTPEEHAENAVQTIRRQMAQVSGHGHGDDEPVEMLWSKESEWVEIKPSQVRADGPLLRFDTEDGVRLCAPSVAAFALRPKTPPKVVNMTSTGLRSAPNGWSRSLKG